MGRPTLAFFLPSLFAAAGISISAATLTGQDAALPNAEKKKLQGTWRLVRTEFNGKVVHEAESSGKCVITGDRIDLRPRIQAIPDDTNPGVASLRDVERVTGSFKPLGGSAPLRMTVQGTWTTARGKKEKTFHILYEVTADELKLLLPLPGKQPNGQLTTQVDSGEQLFVFRREPADHAKLIRDWVLVQTEQDGKIATAEGIGGTCSFWDDRILLYPKIRMEKTAKGIRQDNLEDLFGTYGLDMTKDPKRLTVHGQWAIDGNEQDGSPFQFLYQVDGDTLKILLPAPGKKLPTEWKTEVGTGHRLLTFRRHRPPAAPATGPVAPQPISPPQKRPAKASAPAGPKAPPGWRLRRTFAPRAEGNPSGPLVFSPDGELLMCGPRLLDVATGKNLTFHRLIANQFLGFAADGTAWGVGAKEVVKIERKAVVKSSVLVDWMTGRERSVLRLQDARQLTLSPDGKVLAGVAGRTIRLWNAATGASLGVLADPVEGDVVQLMFSPDGRMLAAGCNPFDRGNPFIQEAPVIQEAPQQPGRSVVTVWEVASRAKRAVHEEKAGFLTPGAGTLAFTADCQRLVFRIHRRGAAVNGGLGVWDLYALKEPAVQWLPGLAGMPESSADRLSDWAVAPDGKSVALVWSMSLVQGRKFAPPLLVVAELATGKLLALEQAYPRGFGGKKS